MPSRSVSTLKFVGVCGLGLYTGLSYSLSVLTIPTLLAIPSANSASKAFTNLSTISLTHLQVLAGISTNSLLLAYIISPCRQSHPYLLWTSALVVLSEVTDFILRPKNIKAIHSARDARIRDRKGKGRQMDASYEVLGTSDRESEVSSEETDDEINGEEVRREMEGFMVKQVARTAIAALGFAMSVIGIWGDGTESMVIIGM